jgi:phage shock protein A
MDMGGDMMLERVAALEAKVRETLAELRELRNARDTLEAQLRAAEGALKARDTALAALMADGEEARGRVDAMLGALEQAAAAESPESIPPPPRGHETGQSRSARRPAN